MQQQCKIRLASSCNVHRNHEKVAFNCNSFSFLFNPLSAIELDKVLRYPTDTLSTLLLERLLVLGLDVLDTTDHVERVLRDVVMLTVEDLLESVDSLLEGDKSTLNTGEDLSDSERLRHESLIISVSFHSPHSSS